MFFLADAFASEFERPRSDPNSALVIDPYPKNSLDWERLAQEPRVVAIIHKATTGTDTLDPAYVARRLEARKRGDLWGSYHWVSPAIRERKLISTLSQLNRPRTS